MNRFRHHFVALSLVLAVGLSLVSSNLRPADEAPTTSPPPGVLRVIASNIHTFNREPTRLALALTSIHPHVMVIRERSASKEGSRSDPNIDMAALRSAGYEIVLDNPTGRGGTHGYALLLRGVKAFEAAPRAAPWRGPCRIPLLVARLQDPETTLIGIHAPPRVPGCRGTNASALMSVAALIEGGRLARDFEPGRKGDRVLLVGDLNAVPWHPATLRLSASGLRDGYARARWLPGPTYSPWAGIPKFIRIDYVFGPSDASFHDAWIVDLPGSDHRGVVVDIQLH